MKYFILLILAIPFIVWNNSFEGPKVLVFLIFGFFLSIFWLKRILIDKKQFRIYKADKFFLLWLLILLAATLFGIHPWESVIGGSYRHQGVLFFLTLWLLGKTVEILDVKNKLFLSKGIGLVVLIESGIILLQYFSGKLYFGKPLGTIGEANAVAGFLAMGLPFVFENFSATFFAIPVISILITESRSGLLAILPSLIPLTEKLGKNLKKVSIISAVILSIIFLIFASGEKGNSPFENRPVIWRLGFNQILQKPILGYGAESGEVVYNRAFYKYGFPLSNLIVDRAHNLFLDVAMWSGTIGLMAFSLFLFERFKNIKENSRKYIFLSFLIYSMLQPLSIVHWLFLFLL